MMGAIMCMGVATANSILVVSFARIRLDEHGNAVPGPTSIPPAAALAASYSHYDDEDEPLDSVDLQLPTETENF